MMLHPAVRQVIAGFEATELHAARSGREVMSALARVAADSQASTTEALAGEIEASVDALLEVMPAYAPPLNVMHQMMWRMEELLSSRATVDEFRTALVDDAETYRTWSEGARVRVARVGAEVVPDGGTVFTFTLSETALRTLRTAWRQGKRFRVLVTESRPNNDGLVTAAELAEEGVPVSVSVDASIGEMVPQADLMIVGAEAIMADGSAVCKVGTYPAALIARAHGVPVYVVVDTMKFNITSVLGLSLWLDPIRREDVLPVGAPSQARVVGHLFDQTPPDLIAGIVTERGILSPSACNAVIGGMPLSRVLSAKLSSWASRAH